MRRVAIPGLASSPPGIVNSGPENAVDSLHHSRWPRCTNRGSRLQGSAVTGRLSVADRRWRADGLEPSSALCRVGFAPMEVTLSLSGEDRRFGWSLFPRRQKML